MEIVWNLIIRKCVQPQIMVKFAINSEIGSSHPPQLIVSLSGASILPALYSFFPCTWWWSFAVMLQFVSSGQSAPTSNYIPSSRVASSSSGTVKKARQVAVAEQMLSIPLKDGCTINWIANHWHRQTGKLGFPKIHWISFRLKLHFNINANVGEQPIAHCFIVHCHCVQSIGAESQLQPLGFVVLTQWWTVGVALATKLGRRTQYR